ncbi:oligosaccharide flippase family protein [Rhodoblastus sp.]|uniref:oligosaccharide flippase family protein n=1 Tax=Rhodoblastus sp. TaxID=1962975 RepID=UPI0035AE914C
MRHRLLKWLGWSSIDAIGRIAMLAASTAVLSRCLSPRDFGVAALALTVVTLASVVVGAPFEEALAQRKVLRLAHLRAALSASWLASLACLLLSLPLGVAMAHAYDEPQFVWALPLGMASIFFSGHSDILTGLIRRRRRFDDLARATLFGNAIGIAASVVIALSGAGVFALVGQRLLVCAARAVLLQARMDIVIWPSRSIGHLRDLARYGGLALVDRMMDNLTFLAFNTIVGGVYGLNTLGFLNMAMRLVEPIRGAIGATVHNIAFSFFSPLQHDPARLRDRADAVISYASLAIAPVFIGLAAVTPTLLPLIAGAGWDQSIEIAICLAIGSAIALPARLVFTALSARARPEYSVIANVAGALVTIAVVVASVGLGPSGVGMARVAGDLAQALIALGVSSRLLGWSRRGRLLALAPAWLLAALMGVLVAGLQNAMPNIGRLPQVAAQIGAGVAIYGLFLALFARSQLSGVASLMHGAGKAAET